MYILQNQKCVAEPSLNNLHVNEYTQALPYYPFAVFLDRCIGSCNTLNFNDLSNGVFVLNQTEDLDLGKCWCGSKNPGKCLVCDICIYIYIYIYICYI